MGSYNQQSSGGMNKPGQGGFQDMMYRVPPGQGTPTMQPPIGQQNFGAAATSTMPPVGSYGSTGGNAGPTPGAGGPPGAMGNPIGSQNIMTWGDYDRFKQGGAYGGTGAAVQMPSPEQLAAMQAQTAARQQGFADQRAALQARNAQIRGQTAPPGFSVNPPLSQGGDPFHRDMQNANTGQWLHGDPYLGGGLLGNQGPRLPLPRRTNGY